MRNLTAGKTAPINLINGVIDVAIIKTFETDVHSVRSVESKNAERSAIAAHIEAFQAAGGKISDAKPSANASYVFHEMTQIEKAAMNRRCGLKPTATASVQFRPDSGCFAATFGIVPLGLFATQSQAEAAIKSRAEKVFSKKTAKAKPQKVSAND